MAAGRSGLRWALTLTTIAGLCVDAYVHLHIAGDYSLVKTRYVSQATLFRVEGAAALGAAAWLLLRGTRLSILSALAVAAAGVGAVVFYRYVDPGVIGPLPDMYEPVWFTDKTVSLVAEAVSAVTATGLLFLGSRRPA